MHLVILDIAHVLQSTEHNNKKPSRGGSPAESEKDMRIEIISAYTNECIGYFGDTNIEKQRCTRVLSRIEICNIEDINDVRRIYVRAITLPED